MPGIKCPNRSRRKRIFRTQLSFTPSISATSGLRFLVEQSDCPFT
jgi:hypothetical protein